MTNPISKSPVGENPVITEATFNTSIERLFRAWTTPEDIKKWFGVGQGGPQSASLDLKVGGRWEFVFAGEEGQTDTLSGQYLQVEQNKLLAFTWTHIRVFANGSEEVSGESKVTVTFEPADDGVFCRLVHEAVKAESARTNIGGGWCKSFEKIQRLLE